ncbi:MAG: Co2+/Mg2+ efflux protein ApaG [Pseudobdellovibrio sp.]
MSLKKIQLPNFEINATSVYIESESSPEQNRYFFAYKVSVKNKGVQTAQLMSRHWIITDSYGHIEEVKGPGIVGLQPRIHSDQIFEYDSACPLRTHSGSMKGYYHFISEDGEPFQVEIPEFYLISPHAVQ